MSSKIKGSLSGLDRVRFRGTLRWLSSLQGMGAYWGTMKILPKDFTDWEKTRTTEIDAATKALAEEAKRPLIYRPSGSAEGDNRQGHLRTNSLQRSPGPSDATTQSR